MHKIVDETLLIRFASNLGDSALVSITQSIYSSGFFQLVLLSFFTFSIMSLGWGIHRKEISKRAIYAALAFLLAYPSQGKPLAYRIVNALSNSTAFVLQKGIAKFTSNSEDPLARNNLPTGLAVEMLVASAGAKLKSDQARALLYGFTLNCLPNALKKDGERANFDDIFNFKTVYTRDYVSGKTILSFQEVVLDEQALRNDNSFSNVKSNHNCFDGIAMLRFAMMEDLKDDPTYLANRNLDGTEEEQGSMEKWVKNWQEKSPKFANLAMNLALAQAAEYEKSRIIRDQGAKGSWLSENSSFAGAGTDKSLRELLIAGDNTTLFGYRFSDAKSWLSNWMENRWSFSLGASIKDLKERLELLPYQLAALKLLLKILCPLAMLTLFFGTFKFLFAWSGAWAVAALTPAIINASRSINNSMLLSKLGIQDLASSEGIKALAYGVDLGASKQLLTDFTPLAYAMIEQEMNIIRYLGGAMIVGSWLAGGGANGFVSWLSNSVQGFLTSSAMGGSVNLASQGIGKGIQAASPHIKSASYTMGQRTRSLVDGVRGEMPRVSYAKMSSHNGRKA